MRMKTLLRTGSSINSKAKMKKMSLKSRKSSRSSRSTSLRTRLTAPKLSLAFYSSHQSSLQPLSLSFFVLASTRRSQEIEIRRCTIRSSNRWQRLSGVFQSPKPLRKGLSFSTSQIKMISLEMLSLVCNVKGHQRLHRQSGMILKIQEHQKELILRDKEAQSTSVTKTF